MTEKEREYREEIEKLKDSLFDLSSRHTRLLIKYIELEDDYFDLKEKLDVMASIRKRQPEYRKA